MYNIEHTDTIIAFKTQFPRVTNSVTAQPHAKYIRYYLIQFYVMMKYEATSFNKNIIISMVAKVFENTVLRHCSKHEQL